MDGDKPSLPFKVWYYILAVLYVLLLMALITLAAIGNGGNTSTSLTDFSLPLLLCSVFLPFHLSVRSGQKMLMIIDSIGFVGGVVLLAISTVEFNGAYSPDCLFYYNLAVSCIERSSYCPNTVPTAYETMCASALQKACANGGSGGFCDNSPLVDGFCFYQLKFGTC